jgi:hypothetical protein
VTNPFGHEERFFIDIAGGEGDPELRLVTMLDEWLHLRHHCRYDSVIELS